MFSLAPPGMPFMTHRNQTQRHPLLRDYQMSLQESSTGRGKETRPGTRGKKPGRNFQGRSHGPRLEILPAAASVKVGDQISITLQGQNLMPMEKTSLTLTYNPAVLTFTQAVEGTFWTLTTVKSKSNRLRRSTFRPTGPSNGTTGKVRSGKRLAGHDSI